jgi:hypothetical protein
LDVEFGKTNYPVRILVLAISNCNSNIILLIKIALDSSFWDRVAAKVLHFELAGSS